jgi:hypothetical protein
MDDPEMTPSQESAPQGDTLSDFYAQLTRLGDAEANHPGDSSFVYGLKIIGRLLVGAVVLAAIPSLLIWLVIFSGSQIAAWLSSIGG